MNLSTSIRISNLKRLLEQMHLIAFRAKRRCSTSPSLSLWEPEKPVTRLWRSGGKFFSKEPEIKGKPPKDPGKQSNENKNHERAKQMKDQLVRVRNQITDSIVKNLNKLSEQYREAMSRWRAEPAHRNIGVQKFKNH